MQLMITDHVLVHEIHWYPISIWATETWIKWQSMSTAVPVMATQMTAPCTAVWFPYVILSPSFQPLQLHLIFISSELQWYGIGSCQRPCYNIKIQHTYIVILIIYDVNSYIGKLRHYTEMAPAQEWQAKTIYNDLNCMICYKFKACKIKH